MKKKALKLKIEEIVNQGSLIAFSAGVDSTLILKLASEISKEKVVACIFTSFLSPKEDLKLARTIAKDYGIRLIEENIDQRNNKFIMNNDRDRCYYCKKMILSRLVEIAKEEGLTYVVDGTNFDDLKVYRPGLKALKELNIKSPLAECKITKKEVREMAEELNISVAKKPSTPCLATRFPYEEQLPVDKFSLIEDGESYLKSIGFNVVRIRLYGEITRIEIPVSEFNNFFEKREEIIKKLKNIGFKYINLDMEGFRSGSMDVIINER